MSDTKKPGRDGDGLMAQLLRHKDEALGGAVMEDVLKTRPEPGPDGKLPAEWTAVLTTAAGTHKTMDVLRAAPEDREAYEAAKASVDAFAAAVKAWMGRTPPAPAA